MSTAKNRWRCERLPIAGFATDSIAAKPVKPCDGSRVLTVMVLALILVLLSLITCPHRFMNITHIA